MQRKKIFSALILLTLISVSSCGPKIDMKNVYGTWVHINDSTFDDPKDKDEVSFTKDGKYKVKYYKNNIVIDSMKGTFELNLEKNLIDITSDPPKLKDMKVIKLTEKEMCVEIPDDLSAHFTSNYRRK